MKELLEAHAMVMEEAVRRSMVASLQRLDLWPPLPSPLGVRPDDCRYDDVDAPMPVVAQRAFNHDAARKQDPTNPYRRSLTAAFLVDFAHESGVPLPGMTDEQQRRFETFERRAAEQELRSLDEPPQPARAEPEPAASSSEVRRDRRSTGDVWLALADDRSSVGLAAYRAASAGPVSALGMLLASHPWLPHCGFGCDKRDARTTPAASKRKRLAAPPAEAALVTV